MTIKDIAKLAGVSTSTVSKIMNQKDDDIRPETRERVLKIVKEYNYTPYASVTASQSTWTLGILLSCGGKSSLMEGLIHKAQEQGYGVMLFYSDLCTEQEFKNITALCSHHVDGIIWEPVSQDSLSFAGHLNAHGIPYITTGVYGGESAINFPYKEYGKLLAQTLIEQNHTNVGCLLDHSPEASAFLSGYKECLFESRRTLNEDYIYYELSEPLIYHVTLHQISGLIVFPYEKCLELYRTLTSLHHAIPQDISLLTLADTCSSAVPYPELSSCMVSMADFGSFLCQTLIDKIQKNGRQNSTFPCVVRFNHMDSVGTPFALNASKIMVVGSINMDTYLRVEQLPHSGKTISTSKSSLYPGGKAMNQAIGASKLGHRVSLIGNVGSDLDSDIIYRTLNEYGIDTFGVKRCSHLNTGKAYIIVENSGDSMISILAGANDYFTPQDIRDNEHLFEDAGYCLIQSEIPLDTVEEACRLAHKHHVKTIFKPSACSGISEDFWQYIDILVPNEKELEDLCPGKTFTMEQQTAYLWNLGIQTIIVTLGERGCYVKSPELEKYFPAARFTTVDNTGASDAFISALASYLLYGYSLENAIKIATYSAGFCISRDGVIPALVEKNSLESYIRQTEPEILVP